VQHIFRRTGAFAPDPGFSDGFIPRRGAARQAATKTTMDKAGKKGKGMSGKEIRPQTFFPFPCRSFPCPTSGLQRRPQD
jgi:hypothetical protein